MAPKSPALDKLTGLASRFATFIVERCPFALAEAVEAFEVACGGREPRGEAAIESLRPALRRELGARLAKRSLPDGLGDPTPGRTAVERMSQAAAELVDACDGFLRRQAIESSLSADERREILRGMI